MSSQAGAERVIHWFRRDLRLGGNTALDHALETGADVIPVFILDEVLLARSTIGWRRLQFLRTALTDLDANLRERGSGLVVRRSPDPVRELNRLATESGAWAVFFNRDFSPYARQRDARATRGLQMTGIVTMPFDDLLLVQPYQTGDADGHIPASFDEFLARWLPLVELDPSPAPGAPATGAPAPGEPGSFADAAALPMSSAGWAAGLAPSAPASSDWPGATPASAVMRLADYVDEGLAGGGSRLSAAIKFGTISIREVAAGAIAAGATRPEVRDAAEALFTRLGRREHAHHLLFANPGWLDPEPAPSEMTSSAAEAGALDAWIQARTGDPAVDAGMRDLHDTGWIPESTRGLLADHLCRQPGVDWRAGERHFARHLIDLDVAINHVAWRAAAATNPLT